MLTRFTLNNAGDTINNRYKIIKPIASEGQICVYLCEDDKNEKKVLKEYFNKHDGKRENNLLKKLDHLNIIEYYDGFEINNKFYIILEYCEKSLNDLITEHKKNNTYFNEGEIIEFLFQITSVTEYIHQKNVLHRNLKPEKILIKNGKIKLCDFVDIIELTSSGLVRTDVGGELFKAPEFFTGNGKHNYKCDIWSIGVFLYLLCTFEKPFKNKDEIVNNQVKVMSYFTVSLNNLLKRILEKDPNRRIEIIDIHVYIHGNFFSKSVLSEEKKLLFERMPLDLLYLNAIFYVISFKSLKVFDNECNSLKILFGNLEKVTKSLENLPNERILSDVDSYIDRVKNYFNLNNNFDISHTIRHFFFESIDFSLYDDSNLDSQIPELILNSYYLYKKVEEKLLSSIINYELKNKNYFLRISRRKNYEDSVSYLVSRISKNFKTFNIETSIGNYENILSNNEKFLENLDKDAIEILKINYCIRSLLMRNFIIGVKGKEQVGRSTFVEMMISHNIKLSSPSRSTTELMAYNIHENIIIIDFPPFDSLKFKQNSVISNFIDHTFCLFNAIEIFDSEDSIEYFRILKLINNNYTIIFNYMDDVCNLKEIIDDNNMFQSCIEKFKEEIFKRINEKDKENVLFTCLIKPIYLDLEAIDEMKQFNIIIHEKVVEKVYKIIADKLRHERIKFKIIENANQIMKKLSDIKKIIIIHVNNNKRFECNYVLSRRQINSFYDNHVKIHSYEELRNDIIGFTPIKNPIFRIKDHPDVIISNFDDFFNNDQHCFEVTNN